MKKLIFLSVFAAFTLISCNNSTNNSNTPEVVEIPTQQTQEKKEVLAENKEAVKMNVEGMTCAMGCAMHIQNKVAELSGVVSSKVDFDEKVATFEFDKTSIKAEEIESFINQIQDGTYKATIVTSEATIDNDNTAETKETLSSVKERFSISFPEIFTHFIKRLR